MKVMSTLFCAAAISAAFAMSPAYAEYPEKPIQIVVPVGTGGDTDFNAREMSKYLQKELGVALPVVNIAGAGGTIGARQVMSAKPDGYKVMFYHAGLMVSTATGIADFGWRDFELAAIAGKEGGTVLLVQKDAPWKTMDDLAAAIKAEPQSLSLTANVGATTYLIAKLLDKKGLKFNLVDVGGSSKRLTAILGGNVDLSQNPYAQVKDYLKNGELRALGTFTDERIKAAPDIPTLKEQGYDIAFQFNFYFAFPKGTPKEIVDKFGAAVMKVVQNPDYIADIKAYAQEPVAMIGDDAVARMEELDAIVNMVDLK
ncbi:tripartite tricarboxylate transporter substrate binding protein [uncultured Cohaesibacter sp.]|uniref:tripartite tricarboxylate transporter substrate binding protein n=1 Tax=uncultured Cohaesibacter sp. TaxID=1002546 RepID=UPI00292E8647|nr:tripartite tricarboxylate transporter substrate binding protein [uncultured Cohaesibacter sp.]